MLDVVQLERGGGVGADLRRHQNLAAFGTAVRGGRCLMAGESCQDCFARADGYLAGDSATEYSRAATRGSWETAFD